MIAVWMLYCVGIGLAFVVVGFALERGLHLAGRPTRWAWVIALAGSYLVPAAAWIRPDAFSTFVAPIPVSAPVPVASIATTSTTSTLLDQPASPSFSLSDLDQPLRWGWALASAAMLVTLAAAAIRLGSLRRQWRRAVVDGRSVFVSQEVGPAVVGFWSPRVVLPDWALALPASDRELMLAHEEQHVRSLDPLVLALGFLAILLAPWNPAVWWQWRRLRLAVETDCDARVLAECRSAPAYGDLLLRVGQRRSTRLARVAAFGEPRSFLESRIRRMLTTTPRWRWAGVATALVVSAGAIVGACETPRPVGPATEALEPNHGSPAGVVGVVSAVISPSGIERPPALLSGAVASFPGLPRLAGILGRVVVQATIETDGRVSGNSITVLESPHPAMSESAKNATVRSVFRPAQIKGRAVPAVVHVVYDFIAAIPRLTRQNMDRASLVQAQGLRDWVERNARQWFPSILEPKGPPIDAFLVHDSRLRVYRATVTTLHYEGEGAMRSAKPIGVAELSDAFSSFQPGHDAWGVVDPRGLRGLVRDNVRVIWIHHDPQGSIDSSRLVRTRSGNQQADRVLRLARQYHPQAFVRPQSNAAIALVMDLEDRVLGHATGIRIPSDASCLDVLTRLLPEFRNAQWLVSGCADGDAQHKLTVYWGTLLKR